MHRLTYRRNNRHLHVRGYKEEGTITTAFDMTVLNSLDRFHLVMDVVDRIQTKTEASMKLKELMEEKLVEHRNYIAEEGVDMPEVRNWKWDVNAQ